MLKILSAEQVRQADAYTIAHEPVRSLDLMERAASACFEWIYSNAPVELFPRGTPESEWRFTVVCGMGNNGGDGLAIARLLLRNGYEVRTLVVHHAASATPDHEENRRRLDKTKAEVIEVRTQEEIPVIPPSDVVIDALFGTGLSRPLEGIAADMAKAVNTSGARVVAIDMPSGLSSDGIADTADIVVQAHYTLTFQVPRLAFFFRENAAHIGRWIVLPIGLDLGSIEATAVPHEVLEQHDVAAILRPRSRFAHKGDHGHALLIAGGRGKMGAAVLTARACVRSGAGLSTVHLPASGVPILQVAVPEAMCSADEEQDLLATLPKLDHFSAIGIGPGMGTAARSAALLKLLIQGAGVPLVVDADALNILAENKTWLGFLPRGTVLTPHPKEFDRMAGASANSLERLARARELATKWGSIIVLKGAYTAICDPSGHVYFNATGNPGMAKGGSGDALTGLLTGLIAQGYPPMQSAMLAVHLHGLAGDLAADGLGMDGMTAGDLIDHLPAAFKRVREAQR